MGFEHVEVAKEANKVKSSISSNRGLRLGRSRSQWQLPIILIIFGMFVLVGVYVLMPQILKYISSENVFLSLVFVGLLLCALLILAVKSGAHMQRKLRRKIEAMGIQNRVLREEMEGLKKNNDVLQGSRRKNFDIINSIKDIIFEADESGCIIFLNNAWQNLSGFEIEQTLGQSLFSILHQDDQQEIRQEYSDIIKGRKDRYRGFTQIRRSDGTFGAVELSLSMVYSDKDASPHVAGTITDIEERRRAERALAEAEKKYRNIVQNAAGGIYQLTPEGLYLSANPALARILGFSSPEQLLREVKNANVSIYVDSDERGKYIKLLESHNRNFQQEVQVYRRDGKVIWVNETARAVRDDAGRVLFVEGSLEDITERKESEINIREAKIQSDLANRAKSEFLSNMSHELRTPLNSIIGFSEMIKNEVFGPVGQKAYWEYAKDIYESGQGLLRIINEILDISKIEAGERQLNEEVVDVKGVVRDCLGLMEHKIRNNALTVTVSMDGAPELVAEELALKQILMNLLSNAVKFTPDDGRITISYLIDNDGALNLSVSDTGVGLDAEGIKKALMPFGQANSEFNRSGSGAGLGLTLVASLVRLHGGEFDLFSQKGIGTTATLVFPSSRLVASGGAGEPVVGYSDSDESLH
ncbi:MAG: PAS domain-containing sensor histidine kinase [Micavibrio sp.]|nr:PAS domain-containing sensor histidine kinase [Micavibrio sp.]